MMVFGLDPGVSVTGYACVECDEAVIGTSRIVEAGIFRFRRVLTLQSRLLELDRDLTSMFDRHVPELVCVESLFAHYAHPRTAITMAHARGVILLAVARRGIPLLEMPPATIKKAVTGNGRATKSQMQTAVATHLGLSALPEPADVADAIAVALTGIRRASRASVETIGTSSPMRSPLR